MAFALDEVWVNNGQLIVAKEGVNPKALGEGGDKVKQTVHIEGNTLIGKESAYPGALATLMVAREDTMGTPRGLYVRGNTTLEGDSDSSYGLFVSGGKSVNTVYVEGDMFVSGSVDCGNKGRLAARFGVADSKPKPFDMEHPSKGDGYRLRYACIEGPEVGVYYRGRIKNEKKIRLPNYWKDLVHTDSITVQLQPIGAHQDIIVKRWDDEFVYLQAQGGLPINCFYHVYAERKDVNPLVVEYEGNTYEDYPDPNYNDPQFKKNVNTRTA